MDTSSRRRKVDITSRAKVRGMLDQLDYIYALVNEKDLKEEHHWRIQVAVEMLNKVYGDFAERTNNADSGIPGTTGSA